MSCAVAGFDFMPGDLLVVGRGTLAREALRASRDIDMVAILLDPDMGIEHRHLLPEFTFPAGPPAHNARLLAQLGRAFHGSTAYLAGDIAGLDPLRAMPIDRALHAFAGATARELDRLELSQTLLDHGFLLGSLHDIPLAQGPVPAWPRHSKALAERLAAERSDFLHGLCGLAPEDDGPDIDFVARSRESALVTRTVRGDATLIVRRWRETMLDTGFVDADMVTRYARVGHRRLVLERDVLLIEPEAAMAAADELDLQILHAGGDERAR